MKLCAFVFSLQERYFNRILSSTIFRFATSEKEENSAAKDTKSINFNRIHIFWNVRKLIYFLSNAILFIIFVSSEILRSESVEQENNKITPNRVINWRIWNFRSTHPLGDVMIRTTNKTHRMSVTSSRKNNQTKPAFGEWRNLT